ncbi:MAG: ferrochelatase [Chloroflexi bacterium]|nr:ferrochelatase [Chloroflexota bacterium]
MAEPTGVLLAALGTPDAPTPEALRPYLKEFLSDMRVVDLNPLAWQIILRLFVLRRRPARSAALYARIWTPDGSPLLVYSRAQVEGLQARLGDGCRVLLGMRYGRPSIAEAMQTFAAEGISRILVFPQFPQFSSTTTGSIYDAVVRAALGRRCPLFFERKRNMPTLRFVPPYYDHPLYIQALKTIIEAERAAMPVPPDRYLFTFHGIPQRYADEGDPYPQQAEITSRLLAGALGLADGQWQVTFQSRFGREPWLQPYTEDALNAGNARSLLAACPGFTADCLETLDEIGHEGARRFRDSGGEVFRLAPCLNAHPAWLDALAAITRAETAGWHGRPS